MIPVNTPAFNGNEKKYLMDCIDTGWLSAEGAYVRKFEESMAHFVGQKYGLAVCNGTSALENAILALNLEPGSEIIMTDFTIISCVRAIVKNGCVPVPVDCNLDDWNMNTSLIEEKITSRTRAIMVVHIYGLPTDMKPVYELARKYNLLIIEDAAEAHGLTYDGKQCGGLGDISIFSFYANKHITCGEGGMLLTSNPEFYSRAKKGRMLFFDAERKYIHEEFGDNIVMTNMQAAVGLAQLEQIEKTVAKKHEIGRIYQEELASVDILQKPVASKSYADNIYWMFGLVIKDPDLYADEVMKKLSEYGVGTRHFFWPIHKQPALLKSNVCPVDCLDDKSFPNSNYISRHGFYIPSGIGLNYEDQKEVIVAIRKVFA